MIVVHHLEKSRSHRVLWLLEELGVAYEVKKYLRDPKTMLAPRELRAIHPLGKAPIVVDGDKVLVESGAILEYLVDTYGRGRFVPPAGTPERLRYTYWMHYAEGSAMPPLLMKLVFGTLARGPAEVPFFVRPIVKNIGKTMLRRLVDPQLEVQLDWIESELAKSTWFAGEELTAADVQMSFPVQAAVARGTGGTNRPRMKAFVERVEARPAYQRALEQGGPFELL